MNDPSKPALRARLRADRDEHVFALPADERVAHERRAGRLCWPLIANARAVSFYIAEGSEMSCAPLIAAARTAGLIVLLPYVTARSVPMRFLRWDENVVLESGYYGLRQPPADAPEMAPDIIVAPLLGFDSELWRIGQGAGFYDRAFAAHPSARRIGLAWAAQQVDSVPRDPWDEPLETIVTEHGIIEGRPRP